MKKIVIIVFSLLIVQSVYSQDKSAFKNIVTLIGNASQIDYTSDVEIINYDIKKMTIDIKAYRDATMGSPAYYQHTHLEFKEVLRVENPESIYIDQEVLVYFKKPMKSILKYLNGSRKDESIESNSFNITLDTDDANNLEIAINKLIEN